MPAPLFTNNPGERFRLPGTYIFEKEPPGFVRGVFLGKVGVCGETLKGPVDTPVSITSEARFIEVFGHRSRFGDSVSVNKVREALMNKPFTEVIVVRAAAAAATTGERDFLATATPIVNIAASSPGAWSLDLTVSIEAASDGDVNHWDLVLSYRGETIRIKDLDTTAGNDNLVEKLGTDLANLVVITKLADGRPDNIADAALSDTVASDGTIADTDYTASGRAIEQIANFTGVSLCAVADRANATINAKMYVEALAASDRMFLIWNGSHTETVTNVAADAANYRSDRIVYCYNSPKTFDFEAGGLIDTPPHMWLMSIMSQTDVDIDPGEQISKLFSGGITELQDESISREDYITLQDAGVAAWERDRGGGFKVVSTVVTDLTAGKTQITRRRMTDFLLLSLADRLRYFEKKKNNATNRAMMQGETEAFLKQLQGDNRVVERYEVDNTVTTDAERAQGGERLLVRVQTVRHMQSISLEAEVGATVIIKDAQ